MAPPEPVFVGTDFSVHAGHAAARAARRAHKTHSVLTLMHMPPAEALAQIREWPGASSASE